MANEVQNQAAYGKEDAYKNLERVIGWINNCDTKASILIAVLGMIVGLTTDVFKAVGYMLSISGGNNANSNVTLAVFQLVFLIAYLAAATIAVFFLMKTLIPRINPQAKSLLFFDNIAEYKNSEDLSAALNAKTDDDLIKDINAQVFESSKICSKKFRYFRKSIYFVVMAGTLAVILLVLINLI